MTQNLELNLEMENESWSPISHCSAIFEFPDGFHLRSINLEMMSQRSHNGRPSDSIRSDDPDLRVWTTHSFQTTIFAGTIHLNNLTSPLVHIRATDGVINVNLDAATTGNITVSLYTGKHPIWRSMRSTYIASSKHTVPSTRTDFCSLRTGDNHHKNH
eukprot:Gregarina_sp_Poly_1__708@NODE_116_length_13672_cov_23_062992_g103_i0_p8_GENE_NODE_116_length_13672_cov_23_062992_g103_i0NODE_116_length_13672_cov_23_062992_g103_i0_p8_ORF_typecomplete_len158_score8_99DUF4486/PF14858_6/0_011DUF4097/PF13349_6/0_025_NODE_116_length_13672_cov_23_062992_g103_i011271600